MKGRPWCVACFLLALLTACESSNAEARRAAKDTRMRDSLREAQVLAWRTYAADLYYYHYEPRSTFVPRRAKGKRVFEVPDLIRPEFPKAAIPRNERRRAYAEFPIGKIEPLGGQFRLVSDQPLVFPRGKAVLPPEDRSKLEAIASVARINDHNFRISVVGYSSEDELDENTDKWDLSVKRATWMVRQLIREGISPHHLEAVGRGTFDPLADSGRRSIDIIFSPMLPRD